MAADAATDPDRTAHKYAVSRVFPRLALLEAVEAIITALGVA